MQVAEYRPDMTYRARTVALDGDEPLQQGRADAVLGVPGCLLSRLSHMTTSVGVHEAKTHLSRLLERVAAGEEVEITNRGRVVARLVGPARRTPNLGFDRGNVWIADDFDDLPEDLQRAFEGEE